MEQKFGQRTHDDGPEVEINITDASQMSIDEQVEKINELYETHVGKAQLVIGLWVLVNVFNYDLEAARSRSPRKQKSFKVICDHENLKVDRRTLRDWVIAAATQQELEDVGVATELLDFTHLREIAKLPKAERRQKIAKRVIDESLSAKETDMAIKTEIEKTKLDDSGASASLGHLAQAVVTRLDDPVTLSKDEDFCEVLLDEEQVRSEFDFREQATIYAKAEKVKQKKLSEKSALEKRFEPVQQSINFLEDVMATMDGRNGDEDAQA